VTFSRDAPEKGDANLHKHWLQHFVAFNLNITQAFNSHPKILVVGLNGPAVGLSAALTGFADFVYIAPHAFVLTPFSSLGLVAEGGASRALAQRLGTARANEALIMSKRIPASDLVQCGYANAVLEVAQGEDARFRELLLKEVDDRLGSHLSGDSMTGIKKLLRRHEAEIVDNQNVLEVFAGLDRFMKGIPQEEFRKLASGEKRHKL
jgi:peroxisomal 3,2-trans-enoyl-CoA isomerase